MRPSELEDRFGHSKALRLALEDESGVTKI